MSDNNFTDLALGEYSRASFFERFRDRDKLSSISLDNIFFAGLKIHERIYVARLTSGQVIFLIVSIYMLLSFVSGLFIGQIVKIFRRWYLQSNFRQKLLKLRAGSDEMLEIADKILETYFPQKDDVLYVLEIQKNHVRRLIKRAANFGYLTLGIRKLAGNIIFINDRLFTALILNDIQTWQGPTSVMSNILAVFGNSSAGQLITFVGTLTESNIRTVATAHMMGLSLSFSLFQFGYYTAMGGGVIPLFTNLLVSTIFKRAAMQAIITGGAWIGGQSLPLSMIISYVATMIQPGIAESVSVHDLKDRLKPNYPKTKLKSTLNEMANNRKIDDEPIVVTGSEGAWNKLKTLAEADKQQMRTSIRQRAINRLYQTKQHVKNRYRSFMDYWLPNDAVNPELLDNDNFYKVHDIQTFQYTPKGTRIPVCSVKGSCPRPLDDGGI